MTPPSIDEALDDVILFARGDESVYLSTDRDLETLHLAGEGIESTGTI